MNNDRVRALYESEIQARMTGFSRVEQIRAFRLLDTEWPQKAGELTPALKVKRRVVESKYATEIESLYQEN